MAHYFSDTATGDRGGVTSQAFHFGEFTLDRSPLSAARGASRLRLEKIPMELLILLVTAAGNWSPAKKSLNAFGAKGVFLDIDHSINTAVRKIRIVLQGRPGEASFR